MSSDFARVYDEHVWRVYGFFAYRLRDRTAAEDLTQTTFERALCAWSRFDASRASEATWLLAIAGNLLIDHHRRDRSSQEEPIEEALLPPATEDTGALGLEPEIAEALGLLEDRERTILALRYGGDLTGPEIADLLELSLANVQQITSRALRKLRVRLGGAERLAPRR